MLSCRYMVHATEKIKVLLVEDEAALVDMYTLKFSQAGFDLMVAGNGEAGLELAKKNLPRVILLDVILPGMDGFAILKALRADPTTTAIPVLLLTNLGQDADLQKGRELGAADYLVKANFTPGEVVERVKAALAGGGGDRGK